MGEDDEEEYTPKIGDTVHITNADCCLAVDALGVITEIGSDKDGDITRISMGSVTIIQEWGSWDIELIKAGD